MPSFGMYTAEGTLLAWLRPSGSAVEEGEPVLEIETEKATHQVLAPATGVLHSVLAAGAPLKEQDVVGYILAPGEAPPAEDSETPAPGSSAEAPASGAAARRHRVETGSWAKASPVARRLAAELGLELQSIVGSGPQGRIVEADVRAALTAKRSAAPRADEAVPVGVRIGSRVPLRGMRGAIAARLRHSLDTAVSLTLTREVEADRLLAARWRLAEELGVEVSYDALFVKLLALGLRECPTLNAIVHGQEILHIEEVNIGFAVSLPGGLIVPVIRDADTVPLGMIARAVRDLTERARSGTLTDTDVAGGTATVTNLGEQGVDAFTPVLNPPQSTILGVGRIRPRPLIRDGSVTPANTCVLSLTFDHRVEDGAPAARVLEVIGTLMNDDAFLTGLA
jgi:pyruvate dehydrogenase E2 component (dihydrolipoamide acetyltransferase)